MIKGLLALNSLLGNRLETKSKIYKKKNYKVDLIKFKNFSSAEDRVKRVKRQVAGVRQYLQNTCL